MVTFAAIGKSDWPRAATERAGGKEFSSFNQTLRQAQGEREVVRYAMHEMDIALRVDYELDPRFARMTAVARYPRLAINKSLVNNSVSCSFFKTAPYKGANTFR